MLDSMFKKFAETSFGTIVLNLFVSCNGDKSCKKCSEEDSTLSGEICFSANKENEEQVKHEKDNNSSDSNSLESEITIWDPSNIS
jgi:hypothetical protein